MSAELDRIPRKVRVAVESCLWALLPLSVPERMQVLDYLRERMPVAPTPSFAPPWRPVEIWYPGIAGNSAGIEVSIEDVRAARSIRVHYDFDRDGFAITAQRDPGDGEWDAEKEDNEPWLEVAFVPAWHREAAR